MFSSNFIITLLCEIYETPFAIIFYLSIILYFKFHDTKLWVVWIH